MDSLLSSSCLCLFACLFQELLKRKGCTVSPQRKDFISALTYSSPPLIKEAYPLHHHKEKSQLIVMLKRSLLPTREMGLEKIRNYFGVYVC